MLFVPFIPSLDALLFKFHCPDPLSSELVIDRFALPYISAPFAMLMKQTEVQTRKKRDKLSRMIFASIIK
jgi:hypothetical protein